MVKGQLGRTKAKNTFEASKACFEMDKSDPKGDPAARKAGKRLWRIAKAKVKYAKHGKSKAQTRHHTRKAHGKPHRNPTYKGLSTDDLWHMRSVAVHHQNNFVGSQSDKYKNEASKIKKELKSRGKWNR